MAEGLDRGVDGSRRNIRREVKRQIREVGWKEEREWIRVSRSECERAMQGAHDDNGLEQKGQEYCC